MDSRKAPFAANHGSHSPDAVAPTASAPLEPEPPTNSNLRDLAVREMSALFTEEIGRRGDECSHTIESVKKALAALYHTCESVLNKLAENKSLPTAAVSGAVDRLVAAAAADVESAAQRTRAEAQIEIGRLQALVEPMQAELAETRDSLKISREEVEHEKVARKSAETAQAEAQAIHHQVVSGLGSQLQSLETELKTERAQIAGLKQQLEAEYAERARMIAALQTVQRAVSFAAPGGPGPDPTHHPKEGETADAVPVNRPLKLVANARASDTESHPELLEYITQLLAEMEAIYWADLRTEGNAADVVDRLTANLRYAHDVFTRRLATSGVGETTLFEQQIAVLLDSKPESSFARHLAIAAHEYSLSQTTGTPRRAEAS